MSRRVTPSASVRRLLQPARIVALEAPLDAAEPALAELLDGDLDHDAVLVLAGAEVDVRLGQDVGLGPADPVARRTAVAQASPGSSVDTATTPS